VGGTSLVEQVARSQTGSAGGTTTSGTTTGEGGGGGARGASGVLPLADPGGRYEIRGIALGQSGRGLLPPYVEPDLSGLDPVSAKITVEVTMQVASSGLVMDPRVVRSAGNPQIDARILLAVRKWLFTPAASSTSMAPAVVTFTIVPRS